MNESTQPACACGEQATESQLMERLDEVLTEYQGKPGALIPVLQIAQGIFGYLPQTVMKRVALRLGKSYSEVAGVVGFYSFFSIVPRGKHLVRVCLGTACYVRRCWRHAGRSWESTSAARRATACSPSKWRGASAPAAWHPRS
jgi:NADH:ubiquinone oxidoreductase subunit E